MAESVAHKFSRFTDKLRAYAKDKADAAAQKKNVLKYKALQRFYTLKKKGGLVNSRGYREYITGFLLYIVIYGFLINYPLFILFDQSLTMYTIPAYGMVYYFAKAELVDIVQDLKK